MILALAAPTEGLAEYSSQITVPDDPFTTYPAASLGCGGWVDWVWGLNAAPYYVEVTITNGSGHSNSAWATTSFVLSSLSYIADVSTTGLTPKIIYPGTPLVNEAVLVMRCYDGYVNFMSESGLISAIRGHISV